MAIFEVEANGQAFEIEAPDINAAMAAFKNYQPRQASGLNSQQFNDRFKGEQPEQSMIPSAIADIPTEIRGAFFENLDAIKKGLMPSGQGGRGQLESLMDTGKGLAAIPGLAMSPITGAARSLLGHTGAAATQAIGEAVSDQRPSYDDLYKSSKNAADLAMMAGGARSVAPKPAAARVPSVEELKGAATAAYQSPEVKGLQVKPDSIVNFAQRAKLSLDADGINDILAPKTFGILQKLETAPPGSVVSGDNINTLRKTLGNAASSPDPTERLAAKRAIEALDDFLPNLSGGDVLAGNAEAAASKLAEARGNYKAAAKAGDIDKETVKAELRAAAANSGLNVANTVRQRMATILNSESQRRGYTPEQIAQMEGIVRGTKPQNAMRGVANVLGGGGGLGTVAASVAGGLATSGPGAAIPIVGFALRALGNRMTLKQAEKLSEAIRSNSPLASSMQKFEERAAALASTPTPSALAGAMIAARNFSTNLKDAGFAISPNDLLRGIQGGVPSRADDEQPEP